MRINPIRTSHNCKVYKGGSWHEFNNLLTSTKRIISTKGNKLHTISLRLVLRKRVNNAS